MKTIIIMCTALIMGGLSLSTANALPHTSTLASSDAANASLLLVGDDWRQHGFGWSGNNFRSDDRFGEGFRWYPRGYYKGFCHDRPSHWWCKKYFFKRY